MLYKRNCPFRSIPMRRKGKIHGLQVKSHSSNMYGTIVNWALWLPHSLTVNSQWGLQKWGTIKMGSSRHLCEVQEGIVPFPYLGNCSNSTAPRTRHSNLPKDGVPEIWLHITAQAWSNKKSWKILFYCFQGETEYV